MITANNVLITSKAETWELLINYFKQHYSNEHPAADNLKGPLLPIITQPGIKSTPALLPNRSISNDLDGMEVDVLWAEQYNKSDTDSEEEGEQIQQMK